MEKKNHYTHLIICITILLSTSLCQAVTVQFTRDNFGVLSEAANQFVELEVEREGKVEFPFTVIIEVYPDTNDFKSNSWTISFPKDESEKSTKFVSVFVEEDDIPEDAETFTFRLHPSPGVDFGELRETNLTILANDDANGIVGFSNITTVTTEEMFESNRSIILNLVRSRGLFNATSVEFRVEPIEEDFDENSNLELFDIYPMEGRVEFLKNESSKEIEIIILNDEEPENDERFIVKLVNSMDGMVIDEENSEVEVVIEENDSPVRFTKEVYRINENINSFEINITRGISKDASRRIGPDGGQVLVDYKIIDGSATRGKDFVAQSSGAIRFNREEHSAAIEVFVIDDDEPEVAENFTIQLFPATISGNAVVVEPYICTVVIEPNDNANGVLAIDTTQAESFTFPYNLEQVFVIRSNEEAKFTGFKVNRSGGSFDFVSVDWSFQFGNDTDEFTPLLSDYLNPTSGTLSFDAGQSQIELEIDVIKKDEPHEAVALQFRLFPESIVGGADMESPYYVDVVIADYNDVYGIFDLNVDESRLVIDEENGQRTLLASVTRSGGKIGDVEISYAAYYLLPGVTDVRKAMPGVLEENRGKITIYNGEGEVTFIINIQDESFLDVNSTFVIILEQVELKNRQPLIPPQTPRLANDEVNITIVVEAEFANSEVGFLNISDQYVEEPLQGDGPLVVQLELFREGLSGDAFINLSYQSVGNNSQDVHEGKDFLKGPESVFMSAGESRAFASLTILPDDEPEVDEIIMIRLDGVEPQNQKLKRSASFKRIVVVENDNASGVFQFDESSVKRHIIKEDESESIVVNIEREEGDFQTRMVECDVIPDGKEQFYGIPEILVFPPGRRSIDVSLVPRDDDIPELDIDYTLVLRSYGQPPSTIGGRNEIQITIEGNDNPHGLFSFVYDDEDGGNIKRIGESKGDVVERAIFKVQREMGVVGNVTLHWMIQPNDTNDVTPVRGELHFDNGETMKTIEIESIADDLPEPVEDFSIILYRIDGYAEIKNDTFNSTLIIESNDKAIYIKGPKKIQTKEGKEVSLTIHRDGTGSDITTVELSTASRTSEEFLTAAADEDYGPILNKTLNFLPGMLDVGVLITIKDDSEPEDDESFFVEIFNAQQDYVTHGNTEVEIEIEENDDSGGIFSFETPETLHIHEGLPVNISLIRERGSFRDVRVNWMIVRNDSTTPEDFLDQSHESADEEFLQSHGWVDFDEDVRHNIITVEATKDLVPEYSEGFYLMLLNATKTGKLAAERDKLLVKLFVVENDYPYGLLSINPNTSTLTLVEEERNENSTATVVIDREMGTDGNIKVLWEIYPIDYDLPTTCLDLILNGKANRKVKFAQKFGRTPNSHTSVAKFVAGSSVTTRISSKSMTYSIDEYFTVSVWCKASSKDYTEVFEGDKKSNLLRMQDVDGENLFSLEFTDENILRVSDSYELKDFTLEEGSFMDGEWHNLVVSVSDRDVSVYLDGNLIKNDTLSNGFRGFDQIHDITLSDVENSFVGMLQDARVYFLALSPSQVEQLYDLTQPDFTTSSGYITILNGKENAEIEIVPFDDLETEGNEQFLLHLLDSTNGAQINSINSSALITILLNDNANGKFSFSQPCQPSRVDEGEMFICHVIRKLGDEGVVTIQWVVGDNDEEDGDFIPSRGEVVFLNGELEKTFNLTAKDDSIPELVEVHNISLVGTGFEDGDETDEEDNTSHGAATIDDEDYWTTVIITENDKPNGVLQFCPDKAAPTTRINETLPERDSPPVIYVEEHQKVISIVVERAGGLFGEVSTEWRTTDGSAISKQEPKDFKSAAGTVTFDEDQQYAYISVELIDDDTSELEENFFVELRNPTGKAELNNASRLEVVISPSDDAFGVYQFNRSFLETEINEPEAGLTEEITLHIIREGGFLGSSDLTWKIQDHFRDDIEPLSGVVSFEPQQQASVFRLNILPDTEPEFNERIPITITEVSRGAIGMHSTAYVTIRANDDPCGKFIFDPPVVRAAEDETIATATIRRIGGKSGDVRLFYETMVTNVANSTASKGIAVAGEDYVAVSDYVTIKENVTEVGINVTLIDDQIPETNEIFFIQLLKVNLVSDIEPVFDSPRLGTTRENLVEIIIDENDSPHGIIEFNSTVINVSEDQTEAQEQEGFLQVTRKLGSFGDIRLRFNVIPGSASINEDFTILSTELTFSEGETHKFLPIRIIDDFTPELDEDFTVQLLPNSITGGAALGVDAKCRVIINQSDDPYGLLGISANVDRVDEPSDSEGNFPVTIKISRRSGLRGVIAVRWNVTILPSPSALSPDADPDGPGGNRDVDITEDIVYFVSDESEQEFTVKILADDVPEDDEIVQIRLVEVLAAYQGRIDRTRDVINITVPANDRPYGDVMVAETSYNVTEEDDNNNTLQVKLVRRGGLHGTLRVVYSTAEVDLISEKFRDHADNILSYYASPKSMSAENYLEFELVDVTSSKTPLLTCAEACLRENGCEVFLYNSISYECRWISKHTALVSLFPVDLSSLESFSPSKFSSYEKNATKASFLVNSQARAGLDFMPQTGASVLFHPGQRSALINITILPDTIPELKEDFKVNLLSTELAFSESDNMNHPMLLTPKSTRISIDPNDHPHGEFSIRSLQSSSTENGSYAEVDELPDFSLEMIVERQGGTYGQVSVSWVAENGNATRYEDYIGDDATLKFDHDEKTKMISLKVVDDDIPEPNEDFFVRLRDPTGGAEIGSRNATRIVILANDVVGGVIGFHPTTRSVISEEGGDVRLVVVRTSPALGDCDVSWYATRAVGDDVTASGDTDIGLNVTEGTLHFDSLQMSDEIHIRIEGDAKPEVNEKYRIILNDVTMRNLATAGHATINELNAECEISIKDSDDPHGIVAVSSTSQRIQCKEEAKDIEVVVSRRMGSIGHVRVFYDIIPGTLSTLNPEIGVAEPDIDFTIDEPHYVDLEDGVTSSTIVIGIIDDDIPELNEIFHVNLTSVELMENETKVEDPFIPPKIDEENNLSQIVIDANDGTKGIIEFQPESVHVVAHEGDVVKLNITRRRGSYGQVSFFVFAQNMEAIIDEDYICENKKLEMNDSETSIEFVIEIIDDDLPEDDETLEVILANPSAGLNLGDDDVTRAYVTIASNDDAHGRVSFADPIAVHLTEPGDVSVHDSRVDLMVAREPQDGCIGRITVGFQVEQIADFGQVIGDVVDDVTPTSGVVVFENGQSTGVITLSAVADSIPEFNEHFRVRLMNATGGSKLEEVNTSVDVIIDQNDAPYGEFSVYPAGRSDVNRTILVQEGPGNAVLNFDIVRKQGTLGSVVVNIETIAETAKPFISNKDLPTLMSPLQTFKSRSAVGYHEIEWEGSNYLLFITNDLDPDGILTTPIGSTGSISSLTSGIHTTLYVWQGVYVPVITFETDGATDATSFVVNSTLYIFIANEGSATQRECKSRLYKLEGDSKEKSGIRMRVIQDVKTTGGKSVKSFHSGDTFYLVIANSINDEGVSTLSSPVLRFNQEKEELELVQSLPTRGASEVCIFTLLGHIYIAIANSLDSEMTHTRVTSTIYRWNPVTSAFAQRTTVDVSHANSVDYFVTDDDLTFVIFSTVSDDAGGGNLDERKCDLLHIYQVNQYNENGNIQVTSVQTIHVGDVISLRVFSIPSWNIDLEESVRNSYSKNGRVILLTVASEQTGSSIYIFDSSALRFDELTRMRNCRQLKFLNLPKIIGGEITLLALATSKLRANQPSGVYDVINLHANSSKRSAEEEEVEGGDFLPLRRDTGVVFKPGEERLRLSMLLLDDHIPEDDETFKIALSNSHDEKAEINQVSGSVRVVIQANDDAHGIIGFHEDSLLYEVEELETHNKFTLTVIRAVSSFRPVTADWTIEGNLHDIAPSSGQIMFENGQNVTLIHLSVLPDDVPEMEESVIIQLSNPRLADDSFSADSPRLNLASSAARVLIGGNDSPHGVVRWSAASLQTVVEEAQVSSGNTQLVTLELIREQGALGDIEVHFYTAIAANLPPKSRATPGVDFISRDGTLVMRENSTRAAVAISIVPDDTPEDIETFYVIIKDVRLIGESKVGGAPELGRAGSELAEVTIDENDFARGFIQFNVTRNKEGAVEAFELPMVNNTLKLPLRRDVGYFRTVGVEWFARPSTASNADFFPSSGSVDFREDQRSGDIIIYITDDDEVEFLESFTVQLIATSGGAELGGDVTVTVNILPNDSPQGMFGFARSISRLDESSSSEDPLGMVEVVVRRYQGSDDEVKLDWRLDESAREDLAPMSGRLIFSKNVREQKILLQSLPDQILEGEEAFDLRLTGVTGGAEISPVAGICQVIISANSGAAGEVSIVDADVAVMTSEPDNGYDGKVTIELVRGYGLFGEVLVEWQITPADANVFQLVQGEVKFRDQENTTSVWIQTIDDEIPEIAHDYVFRILTTSGGSTLDQSANTRLLTVIASDSPHGTFTFSQPIYHVKEGLSENHDPSIMDRGMMENLMSTSSYASVTLLRNAGHLGMVSISVETVAGTAKPNVDYYPISKTLVFTDEEVFKVIDVEIIDNSLPEGPKDFSIEITGLQLISGSSSADYRPIPPQNFTRDSPPVYGEINSTLVRIAKSDGAEGVIEFAPDADVIVSEDIGFVDVPLVRYRGSYGAVSVIVVALNKTAMRNADFRLPASGLRVDFDDGETNSTARIPIVDDDVMEYEESFSLALTGGSGGVKIGKRDIAEIRIKKSDYPDGVLRFVGENKIDIQNPLTETRFILLNVERTGGNQIPTTCMWKIARSQPYISPTSSLTQLDEDVALPHSGEFHFDAGDRAQREISIGFLPSDSAQEPEENFVVILYNYEPAELDATHGNVSITVGKKGHPNGVVMFQIEADEAPQSIDEPSSGTSQLVFPIHRRYGAIGDVNVEWKVIRLNDEDAAEDVLHPTGSVVIYNGQAVAEIIVSILADDVPEVDEEFVLEITSADGGAQLGNQNLRKRFVINENDEPHGVFSIYPDNQRIISNLELARFLQINITRDRGSFGRVVVGFRCYFDKSEPGYSYITTNSGTTVFAPEETWASEQILIPSSAYLKTGDTYTVELLSAELLSNEKAKSRPEISHNKYKGQVKVESDLANALVGFSSRVAHVTDVSQNTCTLKLKRQGLYGAVTVHSIVGYPVTSSMYTSGVIIGKTVPKEETVIMQQDQEEANISVLLLPSGRPESFAFHISEVESDQGGGARINEDRQLVEIDPCGAVRFVDDSQLVYVSSIQSQFNVTVERLYGLRHEITIEYQIEPITAVAGVHYRRLSSRGEVSMKDGEHSATIVIQLLPDLIPRLEKSLRVVLGSTQQEQSIYKGESPRLIEGQNVSMVILEETENSHGLFSFVEDSVHTRESRNDDSDVLLLMLEIERKVGTFGQVSVAVRTVGGGEKWEQKITSSSTNQMTANDREVNEAVSTKLQQQRRVRKATADVDYEVRQINVSFEDGQSRASIPVVILNDRNAEPDETFFVYMHSPDGGAKIDPRNSIVSVVIDANDDSNGRVGIKQKRYVLREDSSDPTVVVELTRTHAFGDVTIYWRLTTSYPDLPYMEEQQSTRARTTQGPGTNPTLDPQSSRLDSQFRVSSGAVTCTAGQFECDVTLTLLRDEIPEFEQVVFFEIYYVTKDATIDTNRMVANITIAESDSPHGLIQFSLSSRHPVKPKEDSLIQLDIERIGGETAHTSVRYYTKQISKVVNVADILHYPAIENLDYIPKDEEVTFEPGEQKVSVTIELAKGKKSPNPLPQMFQVILDWTSDSSEINSMYRISNISIVEDDLSQPAWSVFEKLLQVIDDNVVEDIVHDLITLSDAPMNDESIKVFHASLDRVLDVGRTRALPRKILDNIYEIFCELLDPLHEDSRRGYSKLSDSMDNFALSITTDKQCRSIKSISGDYTSCPHLTVQSLRWVPEAINGHTFQGKGGDFFKLPIDLLPVEVDENLRRCYDIFFVEYSSDIWFNNDVTQKAMSNKVFSVSIGDQYKSRALQSAVLYRVHTSDARISPEGAECVLWSEASTSWLSSDACHVVDDSEDYVDCQCNHMSVYAARGPTDNLAGYNEATYAGCFMVVVAATLVLLGHNLCSNRPAMGRLILLHYFFAVAVAQTVFVTSIMISKDLGEIECSVVGIILHYFWLAQFSWILMQSVNISRVLIMHYNQRMRSFLLYGVFGWGLPAITVVLHIIITYALKQQALYQIYGDMHGNGEICLIRNKLGALFSGILPSFFCALVIFVVGFRLYRVKNWGHYDDIYSGRLNSGEIPFLFWLYFFQVITWIWAILHMAFGFLWILIVFVVFNFLQGIYILITYALLRSRQMKSMNVGGEKLHEDNASGTVYQTSIAQASTGISSLADLNRSSEVIGSDHDDMRWHTRSESADLNDLIIALQSEDDEDTESASATYIKTPIPRARISIPATSNRVTTSAIIQAEVHDEEDIVEEDDDEEEEEQEQENRVIPDTHL